MNGADRELGQEENPAISRAERGGDAQGEEGIRYAPNRIRDTLHRALFGLAAALGPALQDRVLRRFFDLKYGRPDPWSYASTPYQERKAGRALELIPRGAYRRVLEVGCGEGAFSRRLLEQREVLEFLGLDISERAISRAKSRCAGYSNAQFRAENVFRANLEGEFDLVILCEILYYLGESVSRLARRVTGLLSRNGLVVLVHPWPEAKALHACFLAEPGLTSVTEVVEEHAVRPFCVSILERKS